MKLEEGEMASEPHPKIFISYCHTDRDKARRIEADLDLVSVNIVRDERAIRYTDDIESYMKKIRATDYALLLVSDAFLRSVNCMFEVHEFLKDENHKQRVLPVVLRDYKDSEGKEHEGARIYALKDVTAYIRFWQHREADLRKHLASIDVSNLAHLSRELTKIQSISKTLNDFVFLLRGIKHVTFDDLIGNDYRDLLERIGFRSIGLAAIRQAKSCYSQAIGEVDLERRLAFLNRALELFPEYVDALNKRGQVLDELKQYDAALNDYADAISLSPDRAALYISRSYAYIRLKRYDDALHDLEMSIQLNPNHKEAYNNRADVHRRLGLFDRAVEDVQHALRIDPQFDLAFATLAEIEVSRGSNDRFFEYIEKAVALGFPLHKYAFDEVYAAFRETPRFNTLVKTSAARNKRFI